jgi:hypothetical protein
MILIVESGIKIKLTIFLRLSFEFFGCRLIEETLILAFILLEISKLAAAHLIQVH